MATSETSVTRSVDASGDEIKTVQATAESSHIQMVALADDDGNHTGTDVRPLAVTTLSGSGRTIDEIVHVFGRIVDIDNGEQATVWNGAGDAAGLDDYPLNGTVEALQLSSSDNGDTQDVIVEGLTTGSASATETVTLTGQTAAVLSTSFLVVTKIYLQNGESARPTGKVYLSTSGAALTAGVPDAAANVRAIMDPAIAHSEQCIYAVPNGKVGYIAAIAGHVVGEGTIIIARRTGPSTDYRGIWSAYVKDGEFSFEFAKHGNPVEAGLGNFNAGSVLSVEFVAAGGRADNRVSCTLSVAVYNS